MCYCNYREYLNDHCEGKYERVSHGLLDFEETLYEIMERYEKDHANN